MNIQVKGDKQITALLHDWYKEIRSFNVEMANQLKLESDKQIKELSIGEQEKDDILLYHSLVSFRYQVLVNPLEITNKSFAKIEKFNIPKDPLLSYYYHFFKAIYSTILADYMIANEEFEKAKTFLPEIKDPIEEAEFEYRFSSFYYQNYQLMYAIQHSSKAKEIFENHIGYEINIALCDNVYGLACIDLREFELAEEYLNKSLDLLQRKNEEKLALSVRHNLGWLYANQNLSSLAIRHVSEVTSKLPNHIRSLFVEAREQLKMNEQDIAKDKIQKGLKIAIDLGNTEYKHRFSILNELINEIDLAKLEKVTVDAISYFENEKLWDCIQEYAELLAIKFYEKDNHSKASKYFYIGNKASKKFLEKGALK